MPLAQLLRSADVGFACGEHDSTGIIQLRMNNITHQGRIDLSSVVRVPRKYSTRGDYELQPGDVLFNNTNSTELVGKTSLFTGYSEPVVFSNHFTRLRPWEDKLSASFLGLWLYALWLQGFFASICNRWIGQSAVQRDKLLAIEIPLPPLEEQRRVAADLRERLESIERLRGAALEELSGIKALPAALLREAFGGRLA